jgi:hypothetical protein
MARLIISSRDSRGRTEPVHLFNLNWQDASQEKKSASTEAPL